MTYGAAKEIIKRLEELSKTPEGRKKIRLYAKAKYSTKLGLEAIDNIEAILDGIGDIDEMEDNFPIFVGKILYWRLFK